MKNHINQLLHETILIWKMLFVEILISAILYVGLNIYGLSRDTSMLISSIFAIVLVLVGMAVVYDFVPSLKKIFRNANSKSEVSIPRYAHLDSMVYLRRNVLSALYPHVNIESLDKVAIVPFEREEKIEQLIQSVEGIGRGQAKQKENFEQFTWFLNRQQERIEQLILSQAEQQKSIEHLTQLLTEQQKSIEQLKLKPQTSKGEEPNPFIELIQSTKIPTVEDYNVSRGEAGVVWHFNVWRDRDVHVLHFDPSGTHGLRAHSSVGGALVRAGEKGLIIYEVKFKLPGPEIFKRSSPFMDIYSAQLYSADFDFRSSWSTQKFYTEFLDQFRKLLDQPDAFQIRHE